MSDEPRSPVLELRNVSTHYGLVAVLRDVDMEIYAGEMVCLLGGNASGKTTTLKTILGYVTPSGGEQQMVAMGRALMADPKVLLMDEPSMGLAPILVEQVFEIIKKIRELGKTVFVVEQNANMALSIADRGYVLQTGQVVLADTAESLLNNPLMREAYLGEL